MAILLCFFLVHKTHSNVVFSTLALPNDTPTILHFWAPWCGPCQKELQQINRFIQKHPRCSVVLLMVGSNTFDSQSYFQKEGLGALTSTLDEQGKIAASQHIYGLPTTLVLDATHGIVQRHDGPLQWADDQFSPYC